MGEKAVYTYKFSCRWFNINSFNSSRRALTLSPILPVAPASGTVQARTRPPLLSATSHTSRSALYISSAVNWNARSLVPPSTTVQSYGVPPPLVRNLGSMRRRKREPAVQTRSPGRPSVCASMLSEGNEADRTVVRRCEYGCDMLPSWA